jgi:hypothetical protein
MNTLLTDFTTALAMNRQTVPLLTDSDIDAQRARTRLSDDSGDQFTAPLYFGGNDIPSFDQTLACLDEFAGKALFYRLFGKGHLS